MGISDSVQRVLRQKDLEKASDMFSIEMAMMERLNSQKLLNATYIRNLLIRADYERLTSGLHWLEHQDMRYNFPEVMKALQLEYNVSRQNLKDILHGRNDSLIFCSKCGVRITKRCFDRTSGLCSNCFAETLEL
ncbi:MAG: hypothetical protein NC311_11550 [Muribaculaceae bacterium]|nr:hypothetical protein [Muribaculaceae bacterium]